MMLYARHSWVAYGLWAKHALLKGRPTRSLADVLAHHMESEGTKGFTVRELREMFAGHGGHAHREGLHAVRPRVGGPVGEPDG